MRYLFNIETKIVRKKSLNENEMSQLFDIVSSNMAQIGFKIKNDDKKIWSENLSELLKSPDFFLYVVYKNSKIAGFVELCVQNNELILSEIELSQNYKNSHILLTILQCLSQEKEFLIYDHVKFHINKNNSKSIKTFTHLGAVPIKEQPNIYTLSREKLENYLFSLLKKR